MAAEKRESPNGVATVLEQAAQHGAREADPKEVADADRRLEELLDHVAEPSAHQEPAEEQVRPAPSPRSAALGRVVMRTARPVALQGRSVTFRVRGVREPVVGELAEGVSPELIRQALRTGDAVVVECDAHEVPWVVGVLQTRLPRELNLRAETVRIEGDQELLLRAGRSALRLRQDGDVELVGSRISAMSRGLFRLVGRVLRLN